MAKKGGDTRVKRQLAPTFWDVKRKESQFILRVKPGPHSKERAYPLGIILRDILKVANTMRESEKIVNEGKVKVDGVIRRDINFSVGLMDVIELIPTGQAYRFVPKDSKLLVPIIINENEKTLKLIKTTSKVMIKGNKLQYGFHDGKTLISDRMMMVGDSCLVQLPKAEINSHIKFEQGAVVLITSGENAGNVGKVETIRDGIFSLPKRVVVSFADRSVELPVQIVMAVGADKPIIKVN
jgi:small subunit ribosomal protein S4e